MTNVEFLRRWYGKPCDFENAYGTQCVDLARQQFKDVLECLKQPSGVMGAKDFANLDYTGTGLRFIDEAVPQAGDVVVYPDTPGNKHGHIAICIANIGENTHIVLEQNGLDDKDGDGKADGKAFLNWRSDDKAIGGVRKI
jgi:hypothetical protein